MGLCLKINTGSEWSEFYCLCRLLEILSAQEDGQWTKVHLSERSEFGLLSMLLPVFLSV
jgi:hypothetical protein